MRRAARPAGKKRPGVSGCAAGCSPHRRRRGVGDGRIADQDVLDSRHLLAGLEFLLDLRTGKVLAVGGIKEKTMAARRAGISTIILPEDCRRDFEELPDYLKEGLDVHFATEYSDVYDVAFGKSS